MTVSIPEGQVYLDNASTSYPKPECVCTAVAQAVREVGLTTGRGKYFSRINPDEVVKRTRAKIARLLNIPDHHRVIFTYSATDSINTAFFGLLDRGDEVLISPLEHHAVTRALHYLGKERGVGFKKLTADADGRVIPERIAEAVSDATKLICVSHISNVSGTVQPIADIGAEAKRLGIPFMLDAAQSAGSHAIDVQAANVSILAAPGHKSLLGLPGTGILYLEKEISPQPFRVGGTGSFSELYELPPEVPTFYESGTPNVLGIIALDASVDFILETGVAEIERVGHIKQRQMLEHLVAMPQVELMGPTDSEMRGCPIAFNVKGREPSEIGTILGEKYHIAHRAGLHCAPSAHEFFGTLERGGAVRVSPAFLTPDDDVDYFCDVMDEILG
ncbi:MAG: hypothetical protein B1H03_00135 [Planctomycetales bacterium 4484_113]|nr:MAG: hypothetical protein B1H03_00135 [Planctomycetales bacterium 4484_113]